MIQVGFKHGMDRMKLILTHWLQNIFLVNQKNELI